MSLFCPELNSSMHFFGGRLMSKCFLYELHGSFRNAELWTHTMTMVSVNAIMHRGVVLYC